jgi:secreted trypsin-like serine protease
MLRRPFTVAVAATFLAACGDSGATSSAPKPLGVPAEAYTEAVQTTTLVLEQHATSAGRGTGADSTSNIVGGAPIDIEAAPWTTALVVDSPKDRNAARMQICGAVLVAPTRVMTAAHCVTRVSEDGDLRYGAPKNYNVVLGRSKLDSRGGERIKVSRILVAATWEFENKRGDFAVLELATPSAQTPVVLPTADDESLWRPGANARAVGWGCTRVGVGEGETCYKTTGPLKRATLRIQPASPCEKRFDEFDAATQLCAVDPQAQASTCGGDSGGPITVLGNDGRWYLVGLVSYGTRDCKPGDVEAEAFVPASYGENTEWIVVENS